MELLLLAILFVFALSYFFNKTWVGMAIFWAMKLAILIIMLIVLVKFC